MTKFALPLLLAFATANCGGSSSETPPPLEPGRNAEAKPNASLPRSTEPPPSDPAGDPASGEGEGAQDGEAGTDADEAPAPPAGAE